MVCGSAQSDGSDAAAVSYDASDEDAFAEVSTGDGPAGDGPSRGDASASDGALQGDGSSQSDGATSVDTGSLDVVEAGLSGG
jgi:hypothetical protein